MVYLIRQIGVQIAERIIGERGQMHHGVEPVQIAGFYVTDVFLHAGYDGEAITERAVLVQIRVHADDVVSVPNEHGDHHGADVTLVSGDQDAHALTFPDFLSRFCLGSSSGLQHYFSAIKTFCVFSRGFRLDPANSQ